MKNYRYLVFVWLPLHLLCVSMIWLTDVSITNLLYFLIGYVLIGGLGVNIGLHRWASHRSLEVKKSIEPMMIYCSLMSCQGHPLWWAAVHRGYHHKNADNEFDPHSPQHGLWHAFHGWILNHDPSAVNFKFVTDLLRNNFLKRSVKFYEIIILITWIIVGIISLDFLLWGLILPAFCFLHLEGLVNSLCHGKIGYRNFSTNDHSTNNIILGYLNWGNGWHNNHHHKPSSFDFGKSISGNTWEFDPSRLLLPFVKK
jgi:fatty-acid desaturase